MSTGGNVAFFGFMGFLTVLAYIIALATILMAVGIVIGVILIALMLLFGVKLWIGLIINSPAYALGAAVVVLASSVAFVHWINSVNGVDVGENLASSPLIVAPLAIWANMGVPASGIACIVFSIEDEAEGFLPALSVASFTAGVAFWGSLAYILSNSQ